MTSALDSNQPNSIDLYYEDSGTPPHPIGKSASVAVVCVHGFPFDHTIWHPVAAQLKNRVRLILPDLRGHGHSPAVGDVYTMPLLAADLLRLFDRLALPQVVLVGQSMGGYVCLEFARLYPQRLAGLGLAATKAVPDSEEQRTGRSETARRIQQQGIAALDGMVQKLTGQTDLYPFIQSLIRRTDPKAAAAAQLGMAKRADARQWLPQIHVPAFVLAGHEDPFAPLENAEEMARLLPNCRLFLKLENARHMPMLEAPDAVAQAILHLMDRL